MYVGRKHAGEQWTDILGWREEKVTIDNRGYGVFPVSAMSVSVWVNAAAEGRDMLGRRLYVSPPTLPFSCFLHYDFFTDDFNSNKDIYKY